VTTGPHLHSYLTMTKDHLLYIIHQVFEDADDKLLSQYESKYSCMPERNELLMSIYYG